MAKDDYVSLLSEDQETKFMKETWVMLCDMFAEFKEEVEKWFLENNKKPHVVSGRTSSRHSVSSRHSSLSAARLKEEQLKVELEAQTQALKKKHEIEMARLKLKMQEEELDLNTKLDIVNAKARVIEEYEKVMTQGRSYKSSASSVSSCHSLSRPKKVLIEQEEVQDKMLRVKEEVREKVSREQEKVQKNTHGFVLNAKTPEFKPQTETKFHVQASDQPARLIHGTEDAIMSMVKQMRKPMTDIKKFRGNPIEFRKFLRQFKSKVLINSETDDERMNFLEQFTSGEAHKIVSGFSYLDAVNGYPAAMKELEERYGSDEEIAHAFVKRALDWPVIKPEDSKGLDEFSIFLVECENAISSIEAVKVLEYPENMRRLVIKLPFYFHDKWRNLVQQTKDKGDNVKFAQLVQFVRQESKKSNDPTYGKDALKVESRYSPSKCPLQRPGRLGKLKTSCATDVAGTSENTEKRNHNSEAQGGMKPGTASKLCIYCGSGHHIMPKCDRLAALQLQDKLNFLRLKGICFRCFRHGHMSKGCNMTVTCDICHRNHQTLLHSEGTRDQTRVKDVMKVESGHTSDSKPSSACASSKDCLCCHMGAGCEECTMAIIPVKVKLKNGLKAVKTYAFLDPGSRRSHGTTWC